MSEWRFKLLYDGECPFCLIEVRWLQRRNRHGYLAFEDISAPDFDASRYGATREEVMGQIYGVFPTAVWRAKSKCSGKRIGQSV